MLQVSLIGFLSWMRRALVDPSPVSMLVSAIVLSRTVLGLLVSCSSVSIVSLPGVTSLLLDVHRDLHQWRRMVIV